jgi:phosphoribosyl-ATP pyrophosphohydrolase/phosphoribosyl-AMP cyclohydrolase
MSPSGIPSEALLAAVAFDGDGLVPVIAQEARTGMIRMLAWANRDALAATLTTGVAHFWSRSRQASWRKGETSGNTLAVREVRLDCDGDVVLYLCDPEGPSCHTGATSCFYRRVAEDGTLREDDGPADPPALVMARVADVIAKRRKERPEKSYVVSLLDAGLAKINGKIDEESGELEEALLEKDAGEIAHEAADLIFHAMVGLEATGVPIDAVFGELRRRFGVSGIDEKASRKR